MDDRRGMMDEGRGTIDDRRQRMEDGGRKSGRSEGKKMRK